jgi:hypothetical protein
MQRAYIQVVALLKRKDWWRSKLQRAVLGLNAVDCMLFAKPMLISYAVNVAQSTSCCQRSNSNGSYKRVCVCQR